MVGRNFCGYLILRFSANRKNSLNIVPANNSNNKVCDFGSSGTRFELHRGQLFISVSLFFLKVRTAKIFKVFHMNGDGLRTCAPVKSIKTSQQVFIGFKNLPAGYYRDLQTSGQSMCSNGHLAIETSIKSLMMTHNIYNYQIFLKFFSIATLCIKILNCLYYPNSNKKNETAKNHDIDRTLFDCVIPRSITNDQRPMHSN